MAALAREDKAELDQLQRSCPRKLYFSPDLAYMHRLQAVAFISMQFCQRCLWLYYPILLCEANLTAYELLADAHSSEAGISQTKIKELQAARMHYAAALKALHVGLAQFCEIVGLNAEDVLIVSNVYQACPEIKAYLTSGIEPNLSIVAQSEQAFLQCWNTYLGND